ncbi:STAS domain-containing protein [Pedobacter sp. MC2016-14]|uniref:STAS domain-containing protein n=1 Tax=Pedobacter sp. MC2016-14 TaxID=2897327 RepID=UPI001E40450E|nr:STAS domain-containing protein [Pedobacter sp. MC2016-14]MCD0488173.1 STAS domain-containing protein [Pedobacter sp. MC2016-14]
MNINIIDVLKESKQSILDNWISAQLSKQSFSGDLISSQEIKEQSEELLDTLFKVWTIENFENFGSSDFDEVVECLSQISMSRAKLGFTPKETGAFVNGLKNTLLEVLESKLSGDPSSLYNTSKKINNLFDNFSVITFETFIQGREDVINRQTDEISEISTPVIKVWDGILALPIIGTLDSARTQVVMENLLEAIVETGSSIAILDISGVPAVDSLVAQHLMKTVAATRLMGAECVISGIRPEIAQTIVHLGIDLSNIITKASLAHALKFSFQTLKLEVRKQALRPI